MQKSDNHLDADISMMRIQALEWVQGTIQDLILNNVTDCHYRLAHYNDK